MRMSDFNDSIEKYRRYFGRLGEFIINNRWKVLGAYILFLLLGVFFASRVRTDNSYDSYFDKKDPTYSYYNEYKLDFGSDEIGYILYEAPDMPYGPFNIEVMKKIALLTETLEAEVPFVKEVTSLANVEFIEAEGDLIEIHELMLDFPETQETLLELRDLVMKKPIYIGSMINKDATSAAIIIEMKLSSTDALDLLRLDPEGGDGLDNLYPQVSFDKIKEILNRPEFQGINYYFSGDVQINAIYNRVLTSESGLLILLTLSIIGCILVVFFRKWLTGIFGPIIVILLTILMVVGFMGIMDYPVDIFFLMTPTLLMAIGVAQSVHVITEFKHFMATGLERKEALKKTLSHVGMPCMMCAITTAVGFASMSGSKLKALSEFALFGGFGVIMTFIFSVTLLPLILAFGRTNHAANNDFQTSNKGLVTHALHSIIPFNLNHPKAIMVVTIIIFIISILGTMQLQVAFDFAKEFKEKTEIRKNLDYVEKVMGGMMSMEYIFDTETPDGIKDPALLGKIEKLQAFADKSNIVKKTYSVIDILKDMNQSFHMDEPAYYRLPDDRNLIAQYLMMYEMSGGEELENYVTRDYSKTVLEIRAEFTNSLVIDDFIHSMNQFIDENSIGDVSVKLTGIGYLWIKIAEYVANSQVSGYIIAFIIIMIFMIIVFRSFKIGAIMMIPNLMPIVFTLGVMGFMGMHLDYFRLMIATIAIGISVDDTIHMMTRMRIEYSRNKNYEEAVRNSITSVGHAVVITSTVLVCSFLAYLISEMEILSSFGILLSITILTALVADLFVTPALVLLFKPFGKENNIAAAGI